MFIFWKTFAGESFEMVIFNFEFHGLRYASLTNILPFYMPHFSAPEQLLSNNMY